MNNYEKYFSTPEKIASLFCRDTQGYHPCKHIDLLLGKREIECIWEEVEQEHLPEQACKTCILEYLNKECS